MSCPLLSAGVGVGVWFLFPFVFWWLADKK
jgi:hypothetical protein